MANNKVRLPYQIIFLPNLILCSSLYLFHCIFLSFFHKKRYKLEIDSVEENNKEKGEREREKRKRQGEKQRSDKEQTEKKIWTTYIVHI